MCTLGQEGVYIPLHIEWCTLGLLQYSFSASSLGRGVLFSPILVSSSVIIPVQMCYIIAYETRRWEVQLDHQSWTICSTRWWQWSIQSRDSYPQPYTLWTTVLWSWPAANAQRVLPHVTQIGEEQTSLPVYHENSLLQTSRNTDRYQDTNWFQEDIYMTDSKGKNNICMHRKGESTYCLIVCHDMKINIGVAGCIQNWANLSTIIR